ncbi:unnamed protein product [Orchesella dallaii]|uniref:Ricin B lectin domain-containing protein n=1 Tax=Orchesella dallaii TaxID=48710 RepID=A0ABP1Q6L5_9HEXA
MYSKLGILSIVLIVGGSTLAALDDGDFLKIVSVSSGNVLTVSGSDATEGRQVVLSPWSTQSSQKWLAVEALVAGNSFLLMPQRQRYPWARFIRNGGTSPYRDRHNDLPDWTMVLQGNTGNGQVTQEARDGKLYQQWRAEEINTPNGKRHIIKNRQNNQCLQAPGSAPTTTSTLTTTTAAPPTTTTTQRSFFGNIWSSVRSVFSSSSSNNESSARSTRSNSQQSTGSASSGTNNATGNVILAACDNNDVRQHWQLEKLSLEY